MNNDFKPHIDRLQSSGLRATKQRLMICKALFGTSKTFLSEEDGHEQKKIHQQRDRIQLCPDRRSMVSQSDH